MPKWCSLFAAAETFRILLMHAINIVSGSIAACVASILSKFAGGSFHLLTDAALIGAVTGHFYSVFIIPSLWRKRLIPALSIVHGVTAVAICTGAMLRGFEEGLALGYTIMASVSLLLWWKLPTDGQKWPTGCCTSCGYDLRNNQSGVCPECGCPGESQARSAPPKNS